MKQWLQLALAGSVLAVSAFAQPSIQAGSVVNAVSYIAPGLPSYGIAQGAIFTVKGTGLASTTPTQPSAFPLQKSLNGSAVKVTVNGTTVDAIPVYAGPAGGGAPTQINAILPSTTPVGNGTVTVTYNGQTSATAPITVVKSAFGITAINGAGSGPAVIQNANTSTDLRLNTVLESAKPGQVVILWGTGLGPVNGDEAAGPLPGALNTDVKVFVGGKQVTLTYAGRSGCCAGADQIVFVVPSGVEGCYVPVIVQTGNFISNSTTMAIAANGGTCSDPNGLSAADLTRAVQSGSFRTGTIALSSVATSISVPILGNITQNSEAASATFSQYDANTLIRASAQNGFQTIGSCTVFYPTSSSSLLPTDPIKPTYLDAGNLTLTKDDGSLNRAFTKDSTGNYSLTLSSSGTGLPTSTTPAVLSAGSYTVTGTGGSGTGAVGAFSAKLTIPTPVTWANAASITNVTRASDLSITWTGGDNNGYVIIYGFSTGTAATAVAGFYCIEKTSARQFTVPSYVLLSLPPSSTQSAGGLTIPSGFLGVGNAANPARFTASGLDAGYFDFVTESVKSVSYQ